MLLVPMVVVVKLDRLKETKDKHVSLACGLPSAVEVELLFDQPGHVRLPNADDEIIDRVLAVEALATRPVTLLTYDTG